MDPTHNAWLLRPSDTPQADAPHWDPAYQVLGAVELRDLSIYDALTAIGGGQ